MSDWYRKGPFKTNALAALFLPEGFAEAKTRPKVDFGPWVSGVGAAIIESLQHSLSESWVGIEQRKSRVTRVDEMKRIGKIQESVLKSFFDAAEKAGRRDLCGFVMNAQNRLLSDESRASDWIGCLNTSGLKLADRTEAYRCASCFLGTTDRLQSWNAESTAIGYFDEGYAESQLLKSMWESNGMDDVVAHANRIRGELSF